MFDGLGLEREVAEMTPAAQRSEALLHRMLDIKRLVDALHQDALETVNEVAPNKPSASRAYVRSVFALVEGCVSAMSAFLIEGQDVWGWSLSDVETRVLWDVVPNSSVARPEGGRSTLLDRTKQVFKTGRRVFGAQCPADFGGVQYRAFRDALSVRDRLMHPKTSIDMDVALDELAAVDNGRNWFRASTKGLFEAARSYCQARLAAGAVR